jgi:hypothetical protein
MKSGSRSWKTTLTIFFLLGFFANPLAMILGFDIPKLYELIFVMFAALFMLMLFLAIPAKKDSDNVRKFGDE